MELARILQSQGFGSRKQCRTLIEIGEVTVHGALCTAPEQLFPLTNLVFSVQGLSWHYAKHVYIAMHKPTGYECSQSPHHHPSIFSLLPSPLRARGVQCVGRLDQDTTGLLLLSDDGAFIHHYSSPKKHVAKIYLAQVKHPVNETQLNTLRQGVQLHGEKNLSIPLACTTPAPNTIELTIAEGKYHQVKRMIAAIGNRVTHLHRQTIGNLSLTQVPLAHLAPSQWTYLNEIALSQLDSTLPPLTTP
ncbi:MAG: pseudouridine synthase [Ottowia sp.]|nr:pseudouridine synthase [Ottowia sp.]